MRSRRAFTILELMVTVALLTVLVSMALVGYQGYRDRVAMQVDEANLGVLHAAVKLYAYDHNTLPASLNALPPLYYDNDGRVLTCPSAAGAVSYAFAEGRGGSTLQELQDPANQDLLLIVETAFRHRGGSAAVGVSVAGGIRRVEPEP